MAAPPISERHKPHFHRKGPILESVRAATTANVTISTALNNGSVLDGLTLATSDRVLVKDQSTGSQNGIYVVGATPVRDYDESTDDANFGYLVRVREGTVNAGRIYANTNTSAPTIDTTSLTFSNITAAFSLALDDLSDVVITSPVLSDRLRYDGSTWRNSALIWRPVTTPSGGLLLAANGEVVMSEGAP